MLSVPQFEFVVEPYLQGVRIDSFLVKHLRNYSPFRVQRMIRQGMVTINNNPAQLAERVFQGQVVQIRLIEPPDKLIAPEEGNLKVVYEDPWLLVVDKSPNQTVHPVGTIQSGTLCNVVQSYLDQQTKLKGLLRPGIVHRLDRMTSGVIVLTKEHYAHRLLSLQFQRGAVQKEYLAILEGEVSGDAGSVDLPVGQLAGQKSILMSCQADAIKPKPALTEYEVKERLHGRTLVRVKLHTGRLHQIRVHMAALGHPVLGDEFYGPFGKVKPKSHEEIGSRFFSVGRHALHAARCQFKHPVTGVPLDLRTPMPVDLQLAWQTGE